MGRVHGVRGLRESMRGIYNAICMAFGRARSHPTLALSVNSVLLQALEQNAENNWLL